MPSKQKPKRNKRYSGKYSGLSNPLYAIPDQYVVGHLLTMALAFDELAGDRAKPEHIASIATPCRTAVHLIDSAITDAASLDRAVMVFRFGFEALIAVVLTMHHGSPVPGDALLHIGDMVRLSDTLVRNALRRDLIEAMVGLHRATGGDPRNVLTAPVRGYPVKCLDLERLSAFFSRNVEETSDRVTPQIEALGKQVLRAFG